MSYLDRERTVAGPEWTRWLVPPAALAIHLSIGQAYAWSVLKTPIGDTLAAGPNKDFLSGLPFSLAILMLGLTAAFGGTTVERRGPRWSMFASAVFFSGGLLVAALGALTGQLWLVVVGYGGIGGIGLGLGYIAPVSTLIKWFPDRPGVATGLAIMGFGGGALIATPWTTSMLGGFGKGTGGIAATFAVLGVVYFLFMMFAVVIVRVPAPGWRPAGMSEEALSVTGRVGAGVPASGAIKTPQFWFLWIVLCFNVTAGIGILERAAPLYTDYFSNGAPASSPIGLKVAAAATAFVSMLSLVNMAGRFVWSSTSDAVGRKNMYRVYLGIGALLYLLMLLAAPGNKTVFLICTLVILSFYGAGFATIPAYLKDLFGTYQVGAIHGRLLTAWSVAGVLGPFIIDRIVDGNRNAGIKGPPAYTTDFIIMIVLLAIGFVANELIRPVDRSKFVEDTVQPEPVAAGSTGTSSDHGKENR